MSKPTAFTEQEKADLVAYLDGELEGEAARAIEQKLTLDPDARAEADALRRTWDLLDFLPKKEPSPNFTHKTLTRLGSPTASLRGPRRRRPWWHKALLGAGWAAAVAVSALGGYAAFYRAAPREPGDAELVKDLGVVKNKRLFEVVEDVDFIRELDAPDLFGADSPGS